MGRSNPEKAIARIEREIRELERKLQQACGAMERHAEDVWEYGIAQREAKKLSRRIDTLTDELVAIEGEW